MEAHNQMMSGAGAAGGGWMLHGGEEVNDYSGPSAQVKPDPIQPRHERGGSIDGFNDSRNDASFTLTWDWLSDEKHATKIGDMWARSRMEGNVRVIHVGRLHNFGGFTKIKLSMFQAIRMRALIDDIIEQVEMWGQLTNNKLIPLFKGSYKRAFEAPSKRNCSVFWENADIDLGSIAARVSFDTHEGFYKLRILSPVEGAEEKFNGQWLGPVLSFSVEEMAKFRSLITALRHADN